MNAHVHMYMCTCTSMDGLSHVNDSRVMPGWMGAGRGSRGLGSDPKIIKGVLGKTNPYLRTI